MTSMHSISFIMCIVGIIMIFGIAMETRALQDSYLEKRTLPRDFEAWQRKWNQRVANLCLYYCIRIQVSDKMKGNGVAWL